METPETLAAEVVFYMGEVNKLRYALERIELLTSGAIRYDGATGDLIISPRPMRVELDVAG